jgi:SAM-dependent methyltransferase
MKNTELWRPSKFVFRNGRIRASRNPKEVSTGSWLHADLVAKHYDDYLPRFAHGRLLDLGCGKVPLFSAYKDLVTESVCVDWSRSMHGNDHLDAICDLNGLLPFANNEFDTVLLSDVLEHIAEPQRLIGEIDRVLRSNGTLLMNVPFYYWLHEQPFDFYRYTEFALRRFVDSTSLKITVLVSIGGAPEIMADIFAKNAMSLPYIGKSLATAAQMMTYFALKTRVGRSVSDRTRTTFPFGYFLVASK